MEDFSFHVLFLIVWHSFLNYQYGVFYLVNILCKFKALCQETEWQRECHLEVLEIQNRNTHTMFSHTLSVSNVS